LNYKVRRDPMTSQPVPGPLKFVNFRPKPGSYGPPGSHRTLLARPSW